MSNSATAPRQAGGLQQHRVQMKQLFLTRSPALRSPARQARCQFLAMASHGIQRSQMRKRKGENRAGLRPLSS
jgi:hypothetical protein